MFSLFPVDFVLVMPWPFLFYISPQTKLNDFILFYYFIWSDLNLV